MHIRRSFFFFVSVSAAVLACSGGSGSSPGLAGGGPADAQAFFNEFCNAFAPCCARVNKPTDGAACKALYSASNPEGEYNASNGQACLNEVRGRQNAPDFCTSPTGPSCENVFSKAGGGTKQPGETCETDDECAPSNEGEVNCSYSQSKRFCQIVLVGREGDKPCVGTKDGNTTVYTSLGPPPGGEPPPPPTRGYMCDVANGVHCSAQTQACAKIQPVDGPCESFGSHACVKEAYCDSSTKKCAPRGGVGADCSKSFDACTAETRCDQASRKCVARKPDGADCATGDDCISDRCTNKKCTASTGSGGSDLATQLLCGGTTSGG